MLVVLTIAGNALTLVVPKLISHAIDAYTQRTFVLSAVVLQFSVIAFLVFALNYLQNIIQTYASERVARDLRTRLAARIATQSYSSIEKLTPSKLLTHLTSDVDGVKLFVSQAVATIIASLFLIVGASVMLLTINWRLGLSVLGVVPVIGGTFFLAIRKVRVLFKRGQEAIDWLNRVINESILGATLIRILNSQRFEAEKFSAANTESRDIGLAILRIMSAMIPAITLAVNLATIIILLLGGRFVILGSMTLGGFTAFNSYLALLIFPIILLGFMSTVMAQAGASYVRLSVVLTAPETAEIRHAPAHLFAAISISATCRSPSATSKPSRTFRSPSQGGTKTAVIGPTAAGKTQLLYVLLGLLEPTSGTVAYDGEPLDAYDKEGLHRQVGFVFQDSILFNMTLRENIAFSTDVPDQDLEKAIAAAELRDFIASLPAGSRHGGLRARNHPLRRSEAARHAGPRPGAESQGAVAGRFHRARRCHHRARHSAEHPRTVSGDHADFRNAENRARRELRPDHPPDGRRDARHRNTPATHGDVPGIRADLRFAAQHQCL